MLAGSFASTAHGEPRTTNDIDLVIDPTREALQQLVGTVSQERFYLSAEAAEEAWRRRGQFNLVHLESGWKVDLILRKDRPFSHEKFRRRQPTQIDGTKVFLATAEDTIVSKLEWARAGESERQLRDVVGIIDVSGPALDRVYIAHCVHELGIEDLWLQVEHQANSE